MKTLTFYLIEAATIVLQGCTITRPGEIALDIHLGKIKRVIPPDITMPPHSGGKSLNLIHASNKRFSEIK